MSERLSGSARGSSLLDSNGNLSADGDQVDSGCKHRCQFVHNAIRSGPEWLFTICKTLFVVNDS